MGAENKFLKKIYDKYKLPSIIYLGLENDTLTIIISFILFNYAHIFLYPS